MVLCHGFTGDKIEAHFLFVKAARALAAGGLAAYRFDFRGSGESGGEFETMTVAREIADARGALAHAARQPGVNARRIGLLGLSLGGCVAANAAARDPLARSLALWSAVGDPAAWFRSARARYRKAVGPGPVIDLGGLALRRRFFANPGPVNPLTALARCRRRFPVLVVHGTADGAVPVRTADAYFETLRRSGYPARKLIFAGFDHTYNRVEWERAVIASTVEWFRRTL